MRPRRGPGSSYSDSARNVRITAPRAGDVSRCPAWGTRHDHNPPFALRVILAPAITPGHPNCDAKIGFGDLHAFVLALSNPEAWEVASPRAGAC